MRRLVRTSMLSVLLFLAIIVAVSGQSPDPPPPAPPAATKAQVIGQWDERWVNDYGSRRFLEDGTCQWVESGGNTWSGRWWLDKGELTVYEHCNDHDIHIEWKCILTHYSSRRTRDSAGRTGISVRVSGEPVIITNHTSRWLERDTKMPLILIRDREER